VFAADKPFQPSVLFAHGKFFPGYSLPTNAGLLLKLVTTAIKSYITLGPGLRFVVTVKKNVHNVATLTSLSSNATSHEQSFNFSYQQPLLKKPAPGNTNLG